MKNKTYSLHINNMESLKVNLIKIIFGYIRKWKAELNLVDNLAFY